MNDETIGRWAARVRVAAEQRCGDVPHSTEQDGTSHQVSAAEDSTVRMVGQRDGHDATADALPAGRCHDSRCTLLVQHAIADPHVGSRDQFGSHGLCLHLGTDIDTVTSPLAVIAPALTPPKHGASCFGVRPALTHPARSPRLASGWHLQFGRTVPSTSEALIATPTHGKDANTPGHRLRALRPSVASPLTGRPLGSMGSGSLTHPGWQPLPLTTASLSASPLRADAVLLSVTESLSGELFCGVPPFERDQAACAADGGGPADAVMFGWSQVW